MPEFTKSVQHIVNLTGKNEDTITKRLKNGLPIFGITLVTFREFDTRGCPYQISEESYQKLVKEVQKRKNRSLR